MGGITKNRSHLAGPNRVPRRFAEVEVVEGQGREEVEYFCGGKNNKDEE